MSVGLRQLIRGLALMWPRYCFRPECRDRGCSSERFAATLASVEAGQQFES